MDNHPIPQDVTGFQFKLIGSMTIKQFGYVGAGVILSVAFFYAPIAWYIKLLAVPAFAAIGVSLAFLPVAGRPLDLMTSYFLKALVRPNQFIYQKAGGSLSFMELSLHTLTPNQSTQQITRPKYSEASHKKEAQLMSYLYDTSGPVSDLDKRENQLITQLFSQGSIPQSTPSASSNISNVLSESQPQPTPTDQIITQPTQPPEVIQSVAPQAVPSDTAINAPAPTPLTPATQDNQNTIVNNQNLTQPHSLSAPSEFPNVVSGIVKDSRGNILAGILVEVLNESGESIRAFKTNALGQFASATQLANGSYTITFEDPKKLHTFSKIQLDINGTILTPLTIVSTDAREELRRSLFG